MLIKNNHLSSSNSRILLNNQQTIKRLSVYNYRLIYLHKLNTLDCVDNKYATVTSNG
jgi:hypothetical protein